MEKKMERRLWSKHDVNEMQLRCTPSLQAESHRHSLRDHDDQERLISRIPASGGR